MSSSNEIIRHGFADAIGNTPLIRLNRFSELTGCEILGKAEFMNPGGSVKDRAARAIIEAAERSGKLKPGGTLVEGTAGNTGIGFAHVCNARGYRCVIVMPDNQSNEKYQMIETLGAEVLRVKTVPYSDPNHYQKIAGRLADEIPSAVWGNQFDNTANRDAHEQTTGPEIWQQTGGKIDAFVCATGTGGTLGGISRFLKKQNSKVRVTLADPQGSSLYHWLRNGELKATGPGSITEGIGIGRVTANLEGSPIDDALHITDIECVRTVYQLLRDEGLFLGSTSGVNVAAAVQIAKQLGPGHTIVTILCDNGAKYQSRLFNKKWLAEKGLLDAAGLSQNGQPTLLDVAKNVANVGAFPQRLSA
ncbi:cysteine synthase A [Steroidobacter agaridevorans]|uniref:cysteine synthase n=1 Tax=Steroidobacter agaridevorans TaxID=2695856 RepID=A0A829Y8H6_9GAMM|nr:cysteine synthase A [Steroidobacter agaridevorans]GFE79333.1 cysteine synthase A [Steroidobacter agaridevorans]GFE88338.1 cysteine synthase A [Steroidobacter agaridevorans]